MLNYFDYAATSPMSARALKSYEKAVLSYPMNPSSAHSGGRSAKKALERARQKVSSLLCADPGQIVFTSGATEATAIVFNSLLRHKTPGRVIISRIEHDAVKAYIPLLREMGWDVITLKARRGFVDPNDVKDALNEKTRLVAVMAVNNVNGAIQNTEGINRIISEFERTIRHKIIFFSDSVQALGKVHFDLGPVDAASFSSHKIGGPKGVGLLYIRNRNLIQPLSLAGGQEMGLRGGTENLGGIISFAEALKETYENRDKKEEKVARLSKRIKESLYDMDLELNSQGPVSPYIINFSTPLPSEVFTRMLDDKGFFISAGSACSNNAKKSENIIEAMGYSHERAESSVRVSLSDATTDEDVDGLIKAIKEIISGIKALSYKGR